MPNTVNKSAQQLRTPACRFAMAGVVIQIQLKTRKFRCRNDLCRQKIFCERLPKVVGYYGRKTVRLQNLFGISAFVLGGEAGAKTARQIGLQTSGDTLLRHIRRTSVLTNQPVKILGVDDFALPPKELTKAQQLANEQKLARRAADEQHFQKVKQLFSQGVPILRIAGQLKMSRNTVKKFLKFDSAPPRQPRRQRFSPIHQFVPHLRRRWLQGEKNARKLWLEIKAQGYVGAEETLRHFLQKWRENTKGEIQLRAAPEDCQGRAPSAKHIKWLLFSSKKKNQPWETEFVKQLCENSPEISEARLLTKEFHQLLMSRQEQSQGLESWQKKAWASGIGEFIWFANGIEPDRSAVDAACLSQWSQGQTEGQVNRLKFIKRQMFGRAKFDLLKAKVLHQF